MSATMTSVDISEYLAYNVEFVKAHTGIRQLLGPDVPFRIQKDEQGVRLLATLARVPEALIPFRDRVASGTLPGVDYQKQTQHLTLTIGHPATPLELVPALTALL